MDTEAAPSNPPQTANEDNQQPVKDGLIEPESLEVAKWDPERKGKLQCELPEVDLWLVDCTTEKQVTGKRRKLWARGGFDSPAFKKLHEKLGIESDKTVKNNGGGFVKGQAFGRTVTLRTASDNDRPKFVFRVTHEGTPDGRIKPMPFGGLKARGYGTLRTDPIHFQDLVQLHLNWNWRGKSPFISVAKYVNLALLFCEIYLHKRCQGIKIHRIKTVGEGWNHKEHRMFSVKHLAEKLGLHMRDAFEDEYLIEGEIPTACIVKTVDPWNFPTSWVTIMHGISLALHPRREEQKFQKLERLQERIRKVKEMASQLQNELARARAEMNSQKGNNENKIMGEEGDQTLNIHEAPGEKMEVEDAERQQPENGGGLEGKGRNEDATMLEDAMKVADTTKPTQDMSALGNMEPSVTTQPAVNKELSKGTESPDNTNSPDDTDSSEDGGNHTETKKKTLRPRSRGFQPVNWKKAA